MQDNDTKPTQEEVAVNLAEDRNTDDSSALTECRGIPAETEHPVQDVDELDPLPGDQCEGDEGLDNIPTETTAEEVAAIGVKIEETLAFKMAQELGIEMKDMLIRDPNAEVDRSTLRFEDHPLVGGVTRLFQFLNHPRPEEWLIDLDEEYLSDPRQVQALLTHHLHRHLSRLEIHESKASIQIRQILNPDDKLSNWMVMLELVVIPFMIDNDLPMGMTGRDPLAPVSPAAQIHSFAEKQEVAKTGEAPVAGELDHAIPTDVEPVETNLAYDNIRYDNARLDPEQAQVDPEPASEPANLVTFMGDYELKREELRYLDLKNLTDSVRALMIQECVDTPFFFATVATASKTEGANPELRQIVLKALDAGAKPLVFGWKDLEVDTTSLETPVTKFSIGDFELINEDLRNIDPYDSEVSEQLKFAMMEEAAKNPVYFLAVCSKPGVTMDEARRLIFITPGKDVEG